MSGLFGLADSRDAIGVGFDARFGKPFDYVELFAAFTAVMRRRPLLFTRQRLRQRAEELRRRAQAVRDRSSGALKRAESLLRRPAA